MRDLTIEPRAPGSLRAEESVIGGLLISEEARTDIISSGLEAEEFYSPAYAKVYEEVVERYYADDPIDPLSVAEAVGPRLADEWQVEEAQAVDRLISLARPDSDTVSVREHAKIIKRHADYRSLIAITGDAIHHAVAQDRDPEEIAGVLAAAATRVITGSLLHSELLNYSELGRRWTRAMREEIAARQAGVELGAFFDIAGIDDFVKGLRPTELMMLGGDPGVGKTAIAMTMVRNFALRQMRRPPERRVATLFLSLEMGEKGSSDRFAQMESRIEGERLRLGTLSRVELRAIAERWAANRGLPIIANFSGELRESQVKALCVDAIRRHGVGLVVIDHFRLVKTDERFNNPVDADEQIVKFLKATLAKDLNLAVVCLAHTTKNEARRPVMDDLRGSKMISAFADIVAFPYRPWSHATVEQRERGQVGRNEYELIFAKTRSAAEGTGEMWIDMATMTIR